MLIAKLRLFNAILILAVLWLAPTGIARATTCHDCAVPDAVQHLTYRAHHLKASNTNSEEPPAAALATARFRIMFNDSFILDVCQRPDLGAVFRKIIKDRVLACSLEEDAIKQFVEFSEITEKEMNAKIKAHPHNNADARYSLSSGRYSCQEVLHNKDPRIRGDSARKFKLYKNYQIGKATLEEVMPIRSCEDASRGFHDPSQDRSVRVIDSANE